jgi:hypothetical protein
MYTANFQNGIRARTFYYKVSDMEQVVDWWSKFLELEPHKSGSDYSEFKSNDFSIGFVLNSYGDVFSGNRGALMLECDTPESLSAYIERAKLLKAEIIADNLADPQLKSIVFADPLGNEFEIGNLGHD